MTVTEREVKKLLKRWRRVLGIGPEWVIAVTLYRDEDVSPKRSRSALAWITVNSGYSQADLCINAWKIDRDEHDLAAVVVHELLHIVTDRLKTAVHAAFGEQLEIVATDMVESTVEQLSRALLVASRSRG